MEIQLISRVCYLLLFVDIWNYDGLFNVYGDNFSFPIAKNVEILTKLNTFCVANSIISTYCYNKIDDFSFKIHWTLSDLETRIRMGIVEPQRENSNVPIKMLIKLLFFVSPTCFRGSYSSRKKVRIWGIRSIEPGRIHS